MDNKLKILDKYITKQLLEAFLIGIVIFTSIIFATDAFITIVKQITAYGIPLYVAAILVILKLPSMLIFTIPMGVLLATLMTVNRMSSQQEITILRSCGIGIARISKPILICAAALSLLGFTINEVIAPGASKQAKTLTIWAITQKNVPNGKRNFIYKEVKDGGLKRFFHVASVEKKQLNSITVLDLTRDKLIQVIYAKTGKTTSEGWLMENGVVYTISTNGKVLNTTVFESLNFDNTTEAMERIADIRETDLNYFDLKKYIKEQHAMLDKITLNEEMIKERKNRLREFDILMNEKLALPFTAIIFALISIPLAITGPRVRFNRGLLFSILILFIYYILRAVSISLGQAEFLNPVLAAWLPNIVLGIFGFILYYRKAYLI
ncbi:MAG: LptF/LptG family permease [Candidatus Gastranaerophilales bacterium]|nr:LptF/LptG family permease [Candidatus Gastranaerophilales bacterium]